MLRLGMGKEQTRFGSVEKSADCPERLVIVSEETSVKAGKGK